MACGCPPATERRADHFHHSGLGAIAVTASGRVRENADPRARDAGVIVRVVPWAGGQPQAMAWYARSRSPLRRPQAEALVRGARPPWCASTSISGSGQLRVSLSVACRDASGPPIPLSFKPSRLGAALYGGRIKPQRDPGAVSGARCHGAVPRSTQGLGAVRPVRVCCYDFDCEPLADRTTLGARTTT